MSNHVLISGGVVVQSDRTEDTPEGFIPAGDEVVPGYLHDGKAFTAPAPLPAVPDRVSARQFKLQLFAEGILDDVEAFIALQSQAVQIAYENSSTFVRTDQMMQSGFEALNFSSEQIDAFFAAAAGL